MHGARLCQHADGALVTRGLLTTATISAALIVAASTAWAFNEDTRPTVTLLNEGAYKVCMASGASASVCAMKYVSEDDALMMAMSTLGRCKDSDTVFSAVSATCRVDLAYIKQRSGY